MNQQEQMKANLEAIGLPYREVKVFGSQIIVKSHCEETAKKWANVLSKFAKVRSVVEHVEYAKVNKNSVLLPSTVKVWLTGAVL